MNTNTARDIKLHDAELWEALQEQGGIGIDEAIPDGKIRVQGREMTLVELRAEVERLKLEGMRPAQASKRAHGVKSPARLPRARRRR